MKTIKMIGVTLFLLIFTSFCVDESILGVSTPPELAKRNTPPISNAGVDQTITLPQSTATLDGTKSSDKDGRIVSWRWSKKSGPTQYTLTTPTTSKTDATGLAEGVYVFTLTITDNRDGAATDDVQITVLRGTTPPPAPTLTGFTPTSGQVGTAVTIVGTNFTNPTVSFNGTAAIVTTSTATSITTTVPSGATTGNISVVSNGVTLNSTTAFTVTVTPPPPTGETYFSGDMSAVTVSKTSSGYKLNGWPGLYSQVNNIYLNNLSTSDAYAYQQMVPDPAGSGRQVMMGRIIKDDPNQAATSRAQMTIAYNPMSIPVYHTSHRMYMHPDLKYLEQYNGVADWFSLVELWTSHASNMDGDPAGSARWGLSLHKSSSVGSPLFWHLYGEWMQPASKSYQDFWAYDNKTYAVPFGKWFTLDIYIVPGEGSAGKMKITVTPDGGVATTIFDISGTSAYYPGRPDLYFEDYQPFKLYIGDPWLSWMTNNGKYMAIYYNDYKWFKN